MSISSEISATVSKRGLLLHFSIVSFHEISDSRYYRAEEHDFWQVIVSLILAGYRVQ